MACINAAQKLIEEAVKSGMEPDWFLSSLREIGITSSEAIDYVDEFEQHTQICNEKGKAAKHLSPDNHHTNSPERTDSDQALKEPVHELHRNAFVPEDLDFSNVSEDTDSALVISKTFLSLAPHLRNLLGQNICSDPHINKTCCLKLAYGAERSIDVLIDHAQLKNLQEPISRSIWKLIILDKYVDFEHLHAVLDCGYNNDNKAKDFSAGFAIVKKDTLSKKKAVSTESKWIRIFDA
ncbi:hypothetical protein H0H87_006586 [Tephrocybe sp. NHM501043]|nr:hypothetical protein H0H87_006586 [Tephrocybe sp. NHM501043]